MLGLKPKPRTETRAPPAKRWRNYYRVYRVLTLGRLGPLFPGIHGGPDVFPSKEVAEEHAHFSRHDQLRLASRHGFRRRLPRRRTRQLSRIQTAAHPHPLPMIRLALAALAACATISCAQAQTSPTVGRLYTYVRSNQDGTLPETIYQYRASATHLEVGKEVSRCTRAAFVTADMDPERGIGLRFTGGRLARDATQEPFAFLTYENGQLHASLPAASIDETTTVAGEPYIIYDFDLSDFNAARAGRPASREDFRFAVSLIWPVEGATNVFRDLSWADATFAGAETHLNRNALRFTVTGGLNGTLWLDAREGHVLEASFAEPNHTEYEDFRMVLQNVEDDAAESWLEVRRAHWRDCP
jgi:hypothetical protein